MKRHRKVQIALTCAVLVTALAPHIFGPHGWIAGLVVNLGWIWSE